MSGFPLPAADHPERLHVSQRQVIDAHGRQLDIGREKDVFRGSVLVDVGIVLVVPFSSTNW